MTAWRLAAALATAGCAVSPDGTETVRMVGVRTRSERGGTGAGLPSGGMLFRGPADPQVGIPSGAFTMGCVDRDKACEVDEQPAHTVELPEYRIDRFEVTWKRYAECVDAGRCTKIFTASCYVWNAAKRRFVLGAGLSGENIGPDLPVVCVNWAQARQYCRYRGGTLPTEAQWERAARADRRTRYVWGNEPPSCKHVHWHDCVDSTQPVGTATKGASWYGVHDLAGNVWEWVGDWYSKNAYTRPGRGRSPRGPWKGEVRVVRGGSFYDDVTDLRVSYRYGLSPQYGYSTVGFRCAAHVPRSH